MPSLPFALVVFAALAALVCVADPKKASELSTPVPAVELASASVEPASPVLAGDTIFFTDAAGKNEDKRCVGQDLWAASVAKDATDRLPRRVEKIPCVETVYALPRGKTDLVAVVTVDKAAVRVAAYGASGKSDEAPLRSLFDGDDALWPARAAYARHDLGFADGAAARVSVRVQGGTAWVLLELTEKERTVLALDAFSAADGEPTLDTPIALRTPSLPVDWAPVGDDKLVFAYEGIGAEGVGSLVTVAVDRKKGRVMRSDRVGALEAPPPDWSSVEVGQYFVRRPRYVVGGGGRWFVYDATPFSFESKAVATSTGEESVERVPVNAVGVRDLGGLGLARGGLLAVDRSSRSILWIGAKSPFPSDLTVRAPKKPKDKEKK